LRDQAREQITKLSLLDNCLDEIGDYGELRLIVEKGRIRFVEVVKSRRVGEGS
jgi:hypothetical protein